ncbi:MAG: PASTA domain-containing protein, partial [Casimicrobiaceae bacterium]
PASNVFGSQPRSGPAVDPRKREQTSFTYVAHGGGLDSLPATVTLDLLPLNRPPVFTSTAPTRYVAHAPFSFVAHATDPDVGDTVTYALVTYTYNGGNCAIVAATGVLTCNEIQSDNALFLVSATDSQGASTLQTILMQAASGSANVPDVVGQSQGAASAALASAGFSTGDITEVYSGAPSGVVISQVPGAGVTQLLGETVALSVSKGLQPAPAPNVTGSALGSAATVLGASGFSIGATTYVYSSADRGEILSQSPAPGVSQVPGPVDVSVSGGTGLEIQLAQSVTTADAPIDFSVVARAPDGALQPTPPIGLAITPAIPAFSVNAPTVVGGQVVPNANTLGAYTLTVTDPVTHRSASAGFAVSHAQPVGTTSNASEFARFSHVLLGLGNIRDQLQAAHDANDITAMRARLQDMVDLWHTLDLTTLIGSTPVAPEGGFPPQIDDMAAFGVTQTPDDVLYKAVLSDAAADLKTLQDAWTDPTTSLAELNALNATFQTRAKRLQGLVPGEYGLVDGIPALTAILSMRGPRELDAMFKDVETLLANPA